MDIKSAYEINEIKFARQLEYEDKFDDIINSYPANFMSRLEATDISEDFEGIYLNHGCNATMWKNNRERDELFRRLELAGYFIGKNADPKYTKVLLNRPRIIPSINFNDNITFLSPVTIVLLILSMIVHAFYGAIFE